MKNRIFFQRIVVGILGIVFIFQIILGQNVSIIQSLKNVPGVCDQVAFSVTVRNDENQNWNENKLRVKLPCGFEYIKTSVVGAKEDNITQVDNPVFNLETIAQNGEKVITFQASLSCKTLACLNEGAIFKNEYFLTAIQGQKNVVSEPYNVETPNPIITRIQQPFMELPYGDVIQRKIIIKNTRLGRVSNLVFQDIHDPILEIFTDLGTVLTSPAGKLQVVLGLSEFQQIGNQDEYFDFNEEIVLTETIKITGCIQQPKFVQSEISLGWGCFEETCKTSLVRATIKAFPRADPGDKFLLTGDVIEPNCYFRNSTQQKLSISVKPTVSDLEFIEIRINQTETTRGILSGSVEVPQGFTVEYINEKLSACSQNIAREILIKTDRILASEVSRTLDIFFDLSFCENSGCEKEDVFWKASYTYKKACADINDVLQNGDFIAKSSHTEKPKIEFLIGGSADDGKAGVIKFTYNHPLLLSNSGNILIRLSFPSFLNVINTNFAIGNVIPSVNEVVTNGNKVIDLVYPLPFSSSSINLLIPVLVNCADFVNQYECADYISSCIETCEGEESYNIDVYSSFLIEQDCPFGSRIEDCISLNFLSNCQPNCTRKDTIYGYVTHDFTITRKTLGLPDKNGDHIPDPDGQYDMSQIRHEQIYYGDTFDVDIFGKVVTDHRDSVFRNAVVRLFYNTDDVNGGDYLKNALQVTGVNLSLWDKSKNKVFKFQNVPYTYNNFIFEINLSGDSLRGLNSEVPSDFVFQDGDTLHVKITKSFVTNFNTPSVGWNNHQFLLNYSTTVSVTNENILPEKFYFVCGCPKRLVQLIGFNYWSQWTIPGVAQCPGVSNAQGVLFNYGYPVASPGEIKFMVRPVGIKIGKVSNIRLDSLAVSTGIVPQQFYRNFTDNGDHMYVDISEFTGLKNFRAGLRFWLYRSAETCIGESIPATSAEIVYEKNPFFEKNFQDKFTYSLQNYIGVPSVLLEIQQKEYTAILRDISIPIKLINETNNQVRNVFIRPVYDTQSFQDVKIELTSLPVTYPDINGYYVMGNMFQKEKRDIQFKAKANNCGRKKVVFEYGYDCSVYSNPAEKPCFLKRDSFFIDFQDGELEIFTTDDEQSILLCDSIDETSFTIHNSGLGNVFQIKPTITLPRGMNIIPGSCRIIYPSGSNTSFQIPAPLLISNNTYQWDVASFWSEFESNGLASVNQAPDNAFDIAYKTTTDCDFISGSGIFYGVSGEQVCGKPANLLSKTGPIHLIPGNQDSVQNILNVMTPDSVSCTGVHPIQVQYMNEHQENSILYVRLPSGVIPVDGSFQSNLPIIEPVSNSGTLEWNVPEGIQNVQVSFLIRANATSGCFNGIIEVSTSSGRDAFCVATQNFCEIQDISGKVTRSISIVKPTIEILTFEMTSLSGSATYNMRGEILAQNPGEVITGKIYYDVNGDGQITDVDSIITTLDFDPNLMIQGKIVALQNIDRVRVPVSCRLWLIIETGDQCICSSQKVQINNTTIFETDSITLCWNENITLGFAENNGKIYQWDEGSGLSCSQCPNPLFYLPNEEDFVSRNYVRVMTETDIFTGCIHQYTYHVSVQPRQRILNTVDTICAGDTLSFFTTEFSDTYTWSGGQIIENSGSTIKAFFNNSGWIHVVMQDSFFCVEKDSVFVPVREIPSTAFLNDGRFCFGQEFIIGYVPVSGLTYQWIDPKGILENTHATSVKVNTTKDEQVYLSIANVGCTRTDTFDISIYDGVEVEGAFDTIFLCKGDTATITLNGADFYDWGTNFKGTCLNDSCSVVEFSPEDEIVYTFYVVASTREGCKENYTVNVVGIDDSRMVTEQLSLCQGDSVLFSGRIIKTSGLYCDTLSTGDCKYIQCKDVQIIPIKTELLRDSICEGQSYSFMGQTYTSSGTYTFTLQSSTGCDSLVTLELALLPLPSFEIQDTFEMRKGSMRRVMLPTGFNYSWSPPTGLSCATCPDVVITAEENITYSIMATNVLGCPFTRTLRIIVMEVCMPDDIELPNAFTPNGDNKNDLYTIPNLGECDVRITVFNRWGNIVYEESPFDNQWEGFSSSGHELPQGTYYILLESLEGTTRKTGMIDLRRQ